MVDTLHPKTLKPNSTPRSATPGAMHPGIDCQPRPESGDSAHEFAVWKVQILHTTVYINVVFDIRRFYTNMESGQAAMSIVSPAFLSHQSFRGKVHRSLRRKQQCTEDNDQG